MKDDETALSTHKLRKMYPKDDFVQMLDEYGKMSDNATIDENDPDSFMNFLRSKNGKKKDP